MSKSISDTMAAAENFHQIVQETMADAFEQASRMVHIKVIYHRPDSPSLVQEFTWGTQDVLIPAMRLMDRLAQSKADFSEAGGVYAMEQAIMEMQDLVKEIEEDIEAAKSLPLQFDLDFKTVPDREHALMIRTVPFQQAQKFLRHWQTTLQDEQTQGGHLNLVTIAHAPLPGTGHEKALRGAMAGQKSDFKFH